MLIILDRIADKTLGTVSKVIRQGNLVIENQEQTPFKLDLPWELSNILCWLEFVVTLLNCSQNFHGENFLV